SNTTFQRPFIDTINSGEMVAPCITCHSPLNTWGATPKVMNHMPASDTCDNCHISTQTFQRPFIDTINSGEMVSPCGTCHFPGNPWGATTPIP
ncbi:MAG: hypothetical protein KDE08_14780, partial [Rhodobacteraceae bacterium]|nr:hypothetical protein [Paracoccaceae bacterium]